MTAASAPVRSPAGTPGRRAGSSLWIYALLIGGLLIMVGPFLWMVMGSIKPSVDFLRTPPTLWPSMVTGDNFGRLFDQLDFPRFFFNSSVIALAVTVGNLIFCPMLGYALAKLHWRGTRVIMALVLATLMVPAGVTLIPNFIAGQPGPREHLQADSAVPAGRSAYS
jgi:multiple sugar transport system permease protein